MMSLFLALIPVAEIRSRKLDGAQAFLHRVVREFFTSGISFAHFSFDAALGR